MDSQSIIIPSDQIKEFVELGFEKALPTLIKFLEIPSQSRIFDDDYLTNGLLLKTAELLKDWILEQKVEGLNLELHNDEGLSPFLFGEVEGSSTDCQTILFYGHMDKQPPMGEWREGLHPHKPVLEDGKLYGRGGADDGYSIFASVLVIKACQTFGLKHPRIVMLFEADEESGSKHIHHYLKKLHDKIGKVELVICLDSGCANYEQLWTTTTLRGQCKAQFTVKVLTEGVHSGDASGVVPSSFRIARTLLERIENSKTGEIHPDFQVNIPGERYKQAEQAAEAIGQIFIDKFPYASENMKPVTQDPFMAYLNRIWKAQLSVIGIDGIPACKNAGNVLRTHTTLKLSLRLPPTADPQKAQKTIIELLTKDVPYGATVIIDSIDTNEGWNCPPNEPYIQEILNQASEIYFKKPFLSLGEGGSIPLMGALQGLYPTSQFIVTGVLGPKSNAHGPNEFLHVPFTKGLICCLAHFVAQSYPHFKQIKK